MLECKQSLFQKFFQIQGQISGIIYGIMNDLHDFGIRGRLAYFISAFFNERQFRVRIGDTFSNPHKQDTGVPQESILSVTLFSVKIDNIVKSVFPGVECFLYVDTSVFVIDLNICLP